jgi:hypothetical protein
MRGLHREAQARKEGIIFRWIAIIPETFNRIATLIH